MCNKILKATKEELLKYAAEFKKAKQVEYQSWLDNNVMDVINLKDCRQINYRNFVTARWVLTVKRDKDGNFLKAKARWVARGFLDKQRTEQQTDSPTASRPGFRLACQFAANRAMM